MLDKNTFGNSMAAEYLVDLLYISENKNIRKRISRLLTGVNRKARDIAMSDLAHSTKNWALNVLWQEFSNTCSQLETVIDPVVATLTANVAKKHISEARRAVECEIEFFEAYDSYVKYFDGFREGDAQ